MTINELLRKNNISKYKLSGDSGIPYAALNDICKGKAQLQKRSADTVYKPAKEQDVTMEALIEPYLNPKISFELYKSK